MILIKCLGLTSATLKRGSTNGIYTLIGKAMATTVSKEENRI
jgi:hypothetical protein